tara:strand:+ start:78 stop:1271 length:1194 start_codon:yes stop_codon:yes gene_type:complete
MIFDKDFSFLRLRDNFDDAKNLGESPLASINYNNQIRLSKGEVYFQISNSPTPIVFNDNYEVFLVDCNDTEIEDITEFVFIEEFFDTNGIKQIRWEYLCNSEHYATELSFRFRNTLNDDVWYTNLVRITEYDKHLTTRFVYKHNCDLYGTQYGRSDYYQAIRLNTYYRNPINEDTRDEYHEITTNNTVGQRNIKKRKRRYLLPSVNNWVAQRIDTMIISNELYVDCWKMTNTTPVEFIEPVLDSNISQSEFILNPDLSYRTFEYEYQIFEGLILNNFNPFGSYVSGYTIEALSTDSNINIELLTGSVKVFDSSNTLIYEFTESDMVINNDKQLKIISTGTPVENLPNGEYYVNVDAGLVTGLSILNDGISGSTRWAFTLLDGQFNRLQFNNTQFLTN